MTDEIIDPRTITDMPDQSDLKSDAIAQAKIAVELKIESKIAKSIKDFFDKKYGPTWQCVVGKAFNAFVSYESKHFIYFYQGQLAILLFKIG